MRCAVIAGAVAVVSLSATSGDALRIGKPPGVSNMKRAAAAIGVAAVVWGEVSVGAAVAGVEDGSKLFDTYCSGCHLGGGNVIGYARNKTLKKEALAKGGYNSRAGIAKLLAEGAGAMPRYTAYTKKNGDEVPARLSTSEINDVSDYVLKRAEQAWK